MDRIAFDIDSAEGTGGTDVFAAAAADTDVLVYVRDSQSVFIGNHREGLRRAMLGAGAAACAVEMDDAVFFDEDDFAHLGTVLLLDCQRFDGAVGTDVAADRTIVVAETLLEINRGLHDTAEAVFQERRLQDVRRALADTEVARGTILLEMRETDGTRRGEWRPIRDLFGMFVSFSSLPSPSLGQSRYGGQRSGYGCAGCEKGASAVGIAGRFRLYLRWFTR